MRTAFINKLTEMARKDKDIYLITADLGFSVFEKFKDELKIYNQSGKGTIQFPHNKPIPLELIKKIAKHRAIENIG